MTEQAENNSTQEPPPPAKAPKDPVRRWTFILLAFTVLLLGWYLRSDRVTPFTSQARVHALVIPIAPQVSGIITSVGVTNNQVVKAGQELFQINTENFRIALDNARANLENAHQGTGASEASVDAARASLKTAKANEEWKKLDADRMRTIREQDPGAISERRLQSAEASYKAAVGQVETAEANLEKAIQSLGEVGDNNAAVQQAQASVDQAQLDFQRSTVRAPDDGVVTGVRLDKGNFASAGSPQLTFIATEKIWVQADFTENNLGHIDSGDEVAMVFDVLPGQVIKGRVREVGFGVEVDSAPLGSLPTIQNDTNWLRSSQRYPVLIEFDLPTQKGITRLKVGSQVSVVVFTGEHWMFNPLARLSIFLKSILTYAY
jgi:multidrug resistance efflux pump